MKKFALIALATVLVLPAAAAEAGRKHKDHDAKHTYEKPEKARHKKPHRVEVQSENDFSTRERNATFTLPDGEQLLINGRAVYKIDRSGNRFYAPNGSYKASNGRTVVVEDGLLLRVEQPAGVVNVY